MTIAHPVTMNGRQKWVDDDIVERIRFGDPTKGWEGDERLEVYYDGRDDRFELVRLEDDGEYRTVCRSRPGMETLDSRVIDLLLAHDTRRGFNPAVAVNAHNAGVDQAHEQRWREWFDGHFADKFRWALKKDKADYYA